MAYYRAVEQAAASTPARVGVLVVNLGTPDSPSYLDVQRYLAEFLGDRRVIDTPFLLKAPLLYGAILPFRPIRTMRNYRKVWMRGGSPLLVYSQRLADKIGSQLQAQFSNEIRVELAMTYGNPSIPSGVKRLAEQNVKRLLVLPLYPQYCSSTTGSVFDRTSEALQRWRWLPEVRFVNDYYADTGYIDALTEKIQSSWSAEGERSHLLLSYHGIPAAYVAQGDCYQVQAETTTRLVAERLGLGPDEYSHCYQSRFGPVIWLQPLFEDALKKLAKRGVRKMTIISPSFAVDCIETLEEIAIEYRQQFNALGGERFGLVPCLNDDDRHAEVLTRIISNQLTGWVKPELPTPLRPRPGSARCADRGRTGAATGHPPVG